MHTGGTKHTRGTPHPTQINGETRTRAIRNLRASSQDAPAFDILVVGGGVTGAGIALDAASRGLSTAIVEAQDWASGTSSRSSKLVHGGLRYLKMLDFALVREALNERNLLLTRLAPHLVRPAPFFYPLKRPVWDRAFVGAGILLYDVLASLQRGPRAVPWHRHLSRTGVERVFPSFRRRASVGAIKYWDATVDDARLVTALVRSAVAHGAQAASRVEVVDFVRDHSDRIVGALLRDLETGDTFEARARTVISATGVWTEHTQDMAPGAGLKVLASKGIHVVVPKSRISGDAGLVLQTASSVLFVIPWSRYWIIGTTDTPWDENLTHPVPTAQDIAYVLTQANTVLTPPLAPSDVIGSWAGLRPLLQPSTPDTSGTPGSPGTPGTPGGANSAKVSREHTVASPAPGLVAIAGGKLTTYRVMAKDAVDFALGDEARKTQPSVTHDLPLAGAEDPSHHLAIANEFAQSHNLSDAMRDHLIHRYGSDVQLIAQICEADPSAAIALTGAPAYLRAEIVFAIRFEGAMHLDDILERRTRISYEYLHMGGEATGEVAAIARAELGWTASRMQKEIAAWHDATGAYEAALTAPDDKTATRLRLAARDLLPFGTA